MNKNLFILFLLFSMGLVGCSDDDDSGNAKEFTVYSHLGSDKPTVLNSIADLSSYIDLDIGISDLDVATALYDWEGEGFIITPLKEGSTVVTVKEKNKLKHKINVVVEYEGAGNWIINESKITVESDADIKETIKQDMLDSSLFYSQEEKTFYNAFYFNDRYAKLWTMMDDNQYFDRTFLNETQEYEFSARKGEGKYRYKFALDRKSDVGYYPQHKIGMYYVDKTKEYQEKYPNKNVSKAIETQKVECYYNR